MKHVTVEELQHVAVVHPDKPHSPMTRKERLERWAELLEGDSDRQLSTLHGTEFQRRQTRDAMRSVGSPISVAFNDPILRYEGLTGDTYGDARRFFDLSDGQLHDIVCYCHAGTSMSARTAAYRVRAAIGRAPQSGILGRVINALSF